jgi:hypothetical protein
MFSPQSLLARTQKKSLFLHRQTEAWDRLVAEVADLQTKETKARRHAEKVEKIASNLSERVRKDDGKAA